MVRQEQLRVHDGVPRELAHELANRLVHHVVAVVQYEVWLMQETQEGRVSEQQVPDKSFEMFKQLFETKR